MVQFQKDGTVELTLQFPLKLGKHCVVFQIAEAKQNSQLHITPRGWGWGNFHLRERESKKGILMSIKWYILILCMHLHMPMDTNIRFDFYNCKIISLCVIYVGTTNAGGS